MEYIAEPNLLLEALAYLGARANGQTAAYLEERLQARGIPETEEFRLRHEPLAELMNQLDLELKLPAARLKPLFGNLPGFPFNTIGSYSPAFLLFYPVLCRYHGDLDGLLAQLSDLSPDHVARHLLLSLDLADGLGDSAEGCSAVLTDRVLTLSVPAESRLTLLELQRNYQAVLREAGGCLQPVIHALERRQNELRALAERFGRELEAAGYEAYLHETSSLDLSSGICYEIHPFLLGPDTNLSLEQTSAETDVVIFCGVLRRILRRLVDNAKSETVQVYEAIKLLGDRTRFDILCYLRDRPAYGQELSERFGLARNTIHHHMGKLLNAGLVTCTVSGVCVYYSVNKERFRRLLEQQRLLFVDGQNPGMAGYGQRSASDHTQSAF